MRAKGRTICCLLLCICLLCSCAGGLAPGTESGSGSVTETQDQGGEDPVKHKYGLHVESDGTVTLEGKPFWGVGLNYFGASCHYLDSGNDSFEEGFREIASYNIPFVRFPMGGYYREYYEAYDSDPEAMLDKLQQVLDCAAENHVGVIADLFWAESSIPGHVGEPISYLGIEGSRSLEYAREYAAAIVQRFADHPAIWGWEIGNEYNLQADLADKSYINYLSMYADRENLSGYDFITGRETAYFLSEIAKVVRQYDDYRLITSGNSEMRSGQWWLRNASDKMNEQHMWWVDWSTDSFEQFEEIALDFTPDPLDTVSFHLQHGTFGSDTPDYVLEFKRWRRKVTSLEYFKAYADVAKSANKACYFGEFGDMGDMESDPTCGDVFDQVVGWILEAGIQICSSWQFQDFTSAEPNETKFKISQKYNLQLIAEGKQDTEAAWSGD